jgi:N-acetylglutamate synthase-like GNAT family acetyltransferase
VNLQVRDIGTRYEDAATVIRHAFQTNKEPFLNYNANFLASCYAYPGAQPELAPAFFDDDRLVSVLVSLPRHVIFERKRLALALLTLNAVEPEYRSYGLGIEMVAEAVRRARASGFDGAIYYCVDGHPANRTSFAGVKAANEACNHVYTVEYLMKILRAPSSDESEPAGANDFLSGAERLRDRMSFCRVWTADEAAWECSGRYGALSEKLEKHGNRGVLTGYILEGDLGAGCLFLEDLLWDDLDSDARKALLQRLLNRAARSSQIAVVPLWGYTQYDIFHEMGFRKSKRRLNVYLSLWNGLQITSRPEAMYIDAL